MRSIVAMFVLALGACGSERQEQTASIPPAAPAQMPTPAAAPPAKAALLMAIPDDPKALARLESMGYTIHAEQGHLHAPGLTNCPAMGDGPTM